MADLHVGTWVQIRADVPDYGGMIGPIDWVYVKRGENDNEPYGVDLIEPNDSVFFSADELIVLSGQPEGDTRLTRLVVLDGTEYLLVAESLAGLDEQEQELRGADTQCSVSLEDAQAIFADLALTQAHMDGLVTASEAARIVHHCQI